MGEDDSGAGATITDQGSGSDDLTLINAPTYVRTTPIEDATYNYRSIEFNGTDEYADCGTGLGDALGDNYAGDLSVSLWFKADVTSGDDGMFEIGPFAGAYGEINVSLASNHLRFKLNGGGWTRLAAFTDTASWHHLVCIYATGSESDSKMYLDGVDQTALGTEGTFPSSADMDFDGLKTIIGAYVSSTYPFDGNIDEVAVFTSELSAAQVLAIYNGGLPFDISEFSPLGWWRMGEDDAEGTIITNLAFATGSDLVTNGDFASDANWTKGTGWSISGGKASCDGTQTGNTVLKQQSGVEGVTLDLEVGSLYEITFEVVAVSAGAITYVEVGSDTEHTDYSTPQTVVQYHTPTSTNDRISIAGDSTFVGSIDNVVVKKVGGSPAVLVNAPTWSTDTP
jgi:hypothetical protein